MVQRIRKNNIETIDMKFLLIVLLAYLTVADGIKNARIGYEFETFIEDKKGSIVIPAISGLLISTNEAMVTYFSIFDGVLEKLNHGLQKWPSIGHEIYKNISKSMYFHSDILEYKLPQFKIVISAIPTRLEYQAKELDRGIDSVGTHDDITSYVCWNQTKHRLRDFFDPIWEESSAENKKIVLNVTISIKSSMTKLIEPFDTFSTGFENCANPHCAEKLVCCLYFTSTEILFK